ncbi:MAG: methyltransferase domain-containing protein, partial [Humidesulfovibrio sp.]|nr:methyltransferase domain-containing protein [Humidesulfovibrio sp.]
MENLIKLHIGAFDQAIDGWMNIDVTPHIFVARVPFLPQIMNKIGILSQKRFDQHNSGVFKKLKYMDISNGIHLPNKSCIAVFSCHVMEHLFRDEIYNLINETHRVLVEGGICRVVVPDMSKIVDSYAEANPEPFLEAVFEKTHRENQKNYHHWGFTGAYMCRLFSERGFSSTQV